MIEPLLNLRQVAELLGVSDYLVRTRLVKEGLPHIRVGSRLRFRREGIEEWMTSKERQAEARQEALSSGKVVALLSDRRPTAMGKGGPFRGMDR